MKRGLFVTFEGIEGCGKSTQVQLVSAWLAGHGLKHTVTREPGGTAVGSQIRKILLSENTGVLQPVSEALLYLADRFQHIVEVIRPALDAGEIVLCDRYHDSTVAYQGYGRGIPVQWIENIWFGSSAALVPDITILLDLDPQIGLQRSLEKLRARGLDESRFEKEGLEFHIRVREGFLALARLDAKRFNIIDASLPVEKIHESIIQILSDSL
ncbi:dTMP kinase [bacterium]|nr:dTMP kinase [bacterium]